MKNISKILFLIIFAIQIPVTIRLPKSVFTGSNYLSNISSIKAETAEDFLLKASILIPDILQRINNGMLAKITLTKASVIGS